MVSTLKDVAKAAKVNVSTASRSLSGSYGVNAETRERVLAAALRLNYRPNRVARGLVTGRSNTLALLISDIRNPFFAEVARGAEDAARGAGCDLILCNSDFDAQQQLAYMQSLSEKRVDGILMNSVASLSAAQLEKLRAFRIPIVLLNRPVARTSFSTVCGDNFEGGRLAGHYLARLGHRNIVHVTGPKLHGNLTERARGFLEALSSARVAAPVVLYGQNSFAGGRALAGTIFDRYPEATAIFAANDAMAFGIASVAAAKGICIPGDISVMGFDNVELSAIAHPPLTTINQPSYQIGQAGVEMLLRLTQGNAEGVPEHRVLGVYLVERQSCGAPRKQG